MTCPYNPAEDGAQMEHDGRMDYGDYLKLYNQKVKMQIHVETVAPISIPFIKVIPRDYRPKGPFRRPIGKDTRNYRTLKLTLTRLFFC